MPATAKSVLWSLRLLTAHLALHASMAGVAAKLANGGRFLLQRMFGSPH